jgi:hypothetical protein
LRLTFRVREIKKVRDKKRSAVKVCDANEKYEKLQEVLFNSYLFYAAMAYW